MNICIYYILLNCFTQTILAKEVEITISIPESISKKDFYSTVTSGSYSDAETFINWLLKTNQGNEIRKVIQKLLDDGVKNTIDFGYSLWEQGHYDIVREYFPKEFILMYNYSTVKLINHQYRAALKLNSIPNIRGERVAYGQTTNSSDVEYLWIFHPTWENNKVIFTIQNKGHSMYIKLNGKSDDEGNRMLLGDPDYNLHRKFMWALEPSNLNGSLGFYIFSQEFGMPLKISDNTHSEFEREIWGDHSFPYKGKEQLLWSIMEPFPNIPPSNVTISSPLEEYSEELYNAIVSNSFIDALAMTNSFDRHILTKTIEKLLQDNIDNVVQYAFRLWISNHKDVVIENFPQPFKLIFNEDDVKLINTKYNLPLKMDVKVDYYGDRLIWGDGIPSNEYRHRWRIEPIFMNDRVSFTIKNIERMMYMKLSNHPNHTGERQAWGDAINVSIDRLTWTLEPIYGEDHLDFFIVNEQHKQGIKLASKVDKYNDRELLGHNGQHRYDSDRSNLRWKIIKATPMIFAHNNDNEPYNILAKTLYDSILEGLYSNALSITKTLMQNNSKVVEEAVQSLLTTGVRNVISYAYTLWNYNQTDVVIRCFPKIFQSILDKRTIEIVNKQYELPLKMDINTDHYGDRFVWGDAVPVISPRLSWNFISIWEHNRVHFKIRNIYHNMFMKLDVRPDRIGDRKAWGDSLNVPDRRLTWALEPIMKNNQLSFYIINQEFGLGLKMGVDKDSYNDRLVWGHNGNPYENNRLLWSVKEIEI